MLSRQSTENQFHSRMKLFLALVFVSVQFLTDASPLSLAEREEWETWKQVHSRKYSSFELEIKKQTVWLANRKYINEHNDRAHEFGYTLRMNHFGDMTEEEFHDQNLCYSMSDVAPNRTVAVHGKHHPKHLPETVDWRTKGAVTGVKDQGLCGSCYAFSAAGGLEGAHALAHDKLVELSVQNIIDCSTPYGNSGCNGGNMYKAYQYIIDNEGIDTEKSYPYSRKRGQCRFHKEAVGASQIGIIRLPVGNEAGLMEAVATAGPVSVAVDGSSSGFRFYDRGIYDQPNCSTTKLTQAMLVIGYGKHKGKEYWLVKNSWGHHWGMNGYIMMARGKANQCGIATDASFPTI